LDNDSHFLENHTGCFCEVEAFCTLGSEMSKRTVSDEFDGLDAIEKAAIEAALNRCRALARQIESKLRNKRPEHFVDKLSLADFCVSVERAADILKQKGDRSTPDLLPP
jgi:glutathione S-transferase